ncbi:MAG: hypothetical protein AB1607_04425 [Chloroflexota bacterium]
MKKPAVQISDVVFFAVFVSVLASGAQMLSIDSDLGRHITLGNYMLENRIVPTRDLFSQTLSGESRPPYEWLSQVALALAHRLLGLDGVILLAAIIVSASILAVFQYSIHRNGMPLVALFVTLLATAATSLHWLPRPHVITFLLLALWIHNLEEIRVGRPVGIYIFPLIMLFWANLHGGFIFGFLALAAYIAGWLWDRWRNQANGETVRKLLLVGVLSLAASIATPDLWRNWEAVLNNRSMFILSRTVETMPPDFSDPSIAPFAILLFLSAIFLLAHWRTISASHIFLLAGLGFMSFLMTRNIPLFAVASAPVLTELIAKTLNKNTRWANFEQRFAVFSSPNSRYQFPIVLIALAIGFFSYQRSQNKPIFHFSPQVFPVSATNWLIKNPPEGNMFNEFNWGGYLLYRTWPRDLVFVDSQSDFYGEPLMRDYETILLARNDAHDLLGKYYIDWIIISPQSPLAQNLASDSGWTIRYEDAVAIIIARK